MKVFLVFLIAVFSLEFAQSANVVPAVETPPVLKASELIDPKLLTGPDYQVQDEVTTDGYLAHFVLKTTFGSLDLTSVDLLMVRISEVPAMKQLDEMSSSEVFTKAAAAAAQSSFNSLKTAAQNPVDTVKGIPSGVGRFFKKAANSVQKGVDAAKDSGDNGSAGSGNSGSSLPGYNKARRQWAQDLQVDPYTTNSILSKQLDSVAWAAFAGGLTTRIAMTQAPRPITTTIRISKLVWEMPPEDLQALNKTKLQGMNVEDAAIKAFFGNVHYTPTLQTALVSALEEIGAAKDRASVIQLATTADSEEDAIFITGSVQTLANYNKKVPVASIQIAGAVIAATTKQGRWIVPAALDYVCWTEQVKDFAVREDLKAKDRVILLTGKASPRAREGFASAGWKLQEGF